MKTFAQRTLICCLVASLSCLAMAAPVAVAPRDDVVEIVAEAPSTVETPVIIDPSSTAETPVITDTSSTAEVACNPAGRAGVDNGLLAPLEGATFTVGQEIQIRYCSPTYHSTRSLGWDVLAYNSKFPSGGKVLQSGIIGERATAIIDDAFYDRIAIYERQTGYGGEQFALPSRTIVIS
ncbi:unnamed protein product [Parajaminaea phylloscopi]